MIRDARNRRENGYREIQCNQCDHKYRWATMLQRHIESEHERNPLEEITIPLQEEDSGDHLENAGDQNIVTTKLPEMRQRFNCDDCVISVIRTMQTNLCGLYREKIKRKIWGT